MICQLPVGASGSGVVGRCRPTLNCKSQRYLQYDTTKL